MNDEVDRRSEMAELDFESLEDDQLPEGHKSGYVAVAGRPNVGKSTLMNAFLEQKLAIVSPRPQTTRTTQLGILTRPELQMIFVDTPGLIKPRHRLDEVMVAAADESIRDADIVLWLVDAGVEPGAGDRAIAASLSALPPELPLILVVNKIDLIPADQLDQRAQSYRELLPAADSILISALNGEGLDVLLDALRDALPEGPRYFPADQTTDVFVREIAAELVREQLFLQFRDEIPYGSAVRVEEFKRRESGITYIRANIYVERANHKKMVIGAKGAKLRQIGAAARQEIEKLVEGSVYLDLWVKVEPNWRRSEKVLKRFGYVD